MIKYEKNLGDLRIWYDDKGFLCAFAEKEKAHIDLKFSVNITSKQRFRALTTYLVRNRNHALGLFLKLCDEKVEKKKYIEKDGFITGTTGFFNSCLQVLDGVLIYDLSMNMQECQGFCKFDFGVANVDRTHKIHNYVVSFENDYFSNFLREVQEK